MKRRVALVALTLLVGCNALPNLSDLLIPPADNLVIPGGIADLRPYYGRVKAGGVADAGEFMLATCGCGDWRVLVLPTDGTGRTQFPVRFYSSEGAAAAQVRVYGVEGDEAVSGDLMQQDGLSSGSIRRGVLFYTFDAQRGENHTNDADACVKCHIGEDPIWPQPVGHPAYQLNPANCLNCHDVVIE